MEQDEAVQTEKRKTIGQIRRLRMDEASKSMQKTSLTGFVCFVYLEKHKADVS